MEMAARTGPIVPARAHGRGSGEFTRRTRFLSYAGVIEVLLYPSAFALADLDRVGDTDGLLPST